MLTGHARLRGGHSVLAATFAGLLLLGACTPFELEPAQDTAPTVEPWLPADNEVLSKGYFRAEDGEIFFYVVVWYGGEALRIEYPADDGSICYDAATARQPLPAVCPQPETPTPEGARLLEAVEAAT